ncbi:Endonuclease, Uma2 family (restriction endonuclease fold) [Abditibacterium utsteinense]|uniref:Endonuclease, Uma2 family (Restriction endonuclease fold) n=1 Tax=Abditibacterium utsteinense TaxID=1960156 RepID=A0A2S8SWK3_9BACT|nr:Uma2 family endonuclease [Abditibacterium utsteinense]PQV65178.1 Endonuclease, Uma2 family (restriction endonuclease fold) [Abditibacterium utsteinense]
MVEVLTQSRKQEHVLTADEFMLLPLNHAELVDGKVVELVPPMFFHGEIAATIGSAFRAHVKREKLGRVSLEASFRLKKNPDLVRAPDVCFLSNEALKDQNLSTYIEGPPTIAVEIKSKNETLEHLKNKTAEYLEAGCLAVWIVQPSQKQVTVLTPDDGETLYKIGQSILGGEMLPGFELPVAEIFED